MIKSGKAALAITGEPEFTQLLNRLSVGNAAPSTKPADVIFVAFRWVLYAAAFATSTAVFGSTDTAKEGSITAAI